VEKHFEKARRARKNTHDKKINELDPDHVTLATDDEEENDAHKSVNVTNDEILNVTLALNDEQRNYAHNDSLVSQDDFNGNTDGTLANDDVHLDTAHKTKRKRRRFRRKYLQPQPKSEKETKQK
jgi:hypothetical protein